MTVCESSHGSASVHGTLHVRQPIEFVRTGQAEAVDGAPWIGWKFKSGNAWQQGRIKLEDDAVVTRDSASIDARWTVR